MYWKCPDCGSPFIAENHDHECPGVEQFMIHGELPDGEPPNKGERGERMRALKLDLPLREALFYAFHLVLSATGIRDGYESAIDPATFSKAIRRFRPAHKFPGSITPMDDKMYACRVAHRLLNQTFRQQLTFEGKYSSEVDTDRRAADLYRWIRERAAAEGVDPFTGAATSTN